MSQYSHGAHIVINFICSISQPSLFNYQTSSKRCLAASSFETWKRRRSSHVSSWKSTNDVIIWHLEFNIVHELSRMQCRLTARPFQPGWCHLRSPGGPQLLAVRVVSNIRLERDNVCDGFCPYGLRCGLRYDMFDYPYPPDRMGIVWLIVTLHGHRYACLHSRHFLEPYDLVVEFQAHSRIRK